MKKLLSTLIFGTAFAATVVAAEPPAPVDTAFTKYRVGGYGEMLAQFKDYGLNRYAIPQGSSKQHHNEISIPRFVLAFDYKFSPKWILGAEIEFEAGGTGQAYEMETGQGSENLEYETETEKGGEVALEQFHITRLIVPEFNVRAGHLVLPVGLTNAHHEPINFFGTSRPEGETTIIPSTWHETGIEFFGQFGQGIASFDYEAMIVAGLNPNGFNVYNWVKKGKQGLFETDNFSSPAYVARLNWTPLQGLRVGGSIYYNPEANKNCDKLITYDGIDNINILIWSADLQYIHKYFTLRGNYIHGHLPHAAEIAAKNKTYSSKSPYSRKGPIAKTAVTYSTEVGVNVKEFFPNVKNFPAIYPFVHYEYYNPQEKGEANQVMEERCQVSLWQFGLNWRALPNLVVKADYTTRQIGTDKMFGTSDYNSENEFAIGVAYTGWFTSGKKCCHHPKNDYSQQQIDAMNAKIAETQKELSSLRQQLQEVKASSAEQAK